MLEQSLYEPERVVPPPFRVLLTNDDGGDSPFFVPWAAYVQEKLGCGLLDLLRDSFHALSRASCA